VNPAYGGGRFIPAICKLSPPLPRFAVHDASHPRQGVRGYAYVIWGTAGSAKHVVASFDGGTAQAAVLNVSPRLARTLGEPPFSLFVVDLPRSAACAPVTVTGQGESEEIAPQARPCSASIGPSTSR
jgi:hypothetical protein